MTQPQTDLYNAAEAALKDWWYKDEDGKIHAARCDGNGIEDLPEPRAALDSMLKLMRSAKPYSG